MGGTLTTRKHGIECGGAIAVEEVEKRQCCKCREPCIKCWKYFGEIMLLVMDALLIG